MEVSFGTANENTTPAHHIVIAAQKEMYRVPVPAQLRAVVTAQRATTHHSDFHLAPPS
jgi:hypothetical protein